MLTKQRMHRTRLAAAAAGGKGSAVPKDDSTPIGTSWVPEANPFQRQWHSTPLVASSADK